METKTIGRPLKSWNLQQLNIERKKDLAACNDAFERDNIDAICKKEIIAVAMTKKLTHADISVLRSIFSDDALSGYGLL